MDREDTPFDIICGAALYWETNLWQRPHQIMSRFSEKRKVFYVRPLDWQIYRQDKKSWPKEKRFFHPNKNVHIYSPLIFPYGRKLGTIRTLNNIMMISRIKRECRERGLNNKKILWLYSPLSSYLIGKLGESLVVYDCMDDHGSFQNADPALKENEEWILKRADLVFAGGKSLYESRKLKNGNCHLFPSAVDSEHFSRALREETEVPQDLKIIPKPIIGYFGAVDERLDYQLLDELARKNRDCSFVFIGPILKVRKDQLPQSENIYYLGRKEYETLPAYIKGFDVGLMPFAMTPLTRMISPTKTPEYLTAGCRVVSTPVPDVVADYAGLVRIGANATEISNNILEILNSEEPEKVKKGIEVASNRSWDKMVEKMENLVLERIEAK